MNTTLTKWGNSHGIRIPKYILDTLEIKDTDYLDIITRDNEIVIKKITPKAYKSIEDLFEGYTGDYKPIEIDFGEPVGKEVW